MLRKILIGLALLLIAAIVIVFGILPGRLEMAANKVLVSPPYLADEAARKLHGKLFVADLHADSLLWNRNLLYRSQRGQVDVPRLVEGGVGLQAFTIVSKSPRGQNIESNSGDTDNITLLAIINMWPLRTWTSLKERALFQAGMFHKYAAESGGKLTVIKSSGDMAAYLAKRATAKGITAGFLGVEGAQVLEGKLENVDVMFQAGIRMMSPAHFFDSDIGGSAHGMAKGGLTPLGREVLKRMELLGMVVDLAHASSQTIDDALSIATRPVVVSHTGVRGTCDNQRNLSDDQLRRIAANGGLIGVGYWETAVCGRDTAAIVRAIRHAVMVAGVEHIALGSDFDGAVTEPFDTTGLPMLAQALIQEGFTEGDIARIMGGNVRDFVLKNFPR